mmetsp:Transcript_10777/g.21839  ORF Transcript_10777/g.21839 Transcript_10777/m.21839 type:complete len:87 (-) Transcript_10777:383-643(-)
MGQSDSTTFKHDILLLLYNTMYVLRESSVTVAGTTPPKEIISCTREHEAHVYCTSMYALPVLALVSVACYWAIPLLTASGLAKSSS